MKKIALSLGCLALGAAAPVVCHAEGTEAAPQPAATVTAQDPAVRAYMLRMVACMMDDAARQVESAEAEPVSAFVASFEATQKAAQAIPTADLPEEFQAYIRETYAIRANFVEQCRALIPEDGLPISDEARSELQAIELETMVLFEQLEETYPNAAATIGREALKDFLDQAADELSLKEKAAGWAETHADELEAKGPAAMADVFRFIAGELRKAADAL